jgi:glycosyltransferase involved in cell wall biosynthesis
MRRLKVTGHVRGLSGYDHHTREFVREFVRQGVDVEMRHVSGWSAERPAHAREIWFDRLTGPVPANTVLHFLMPTIAVCEPGHTNINYTMFEADRIPAAWAATARQMDMTILPTEAARRAWIDSGVPEDRLRVSPLGVDGARFAACAEPLALEVAGRPVGGFAVRLLNVTDLSPRKHYLGLLQTWLVATRREDDAVLILKNNAFQPDVWPVFQAELSALEQRTGRSFGDAAPMLILGHPLGNVEMPALYTAATHYVSLSRGEGWDMPMMEAAASGLVLIAPRHTAYLSYLDDQSAHWIDARLAPAMVDCRIRAADRIWFEGLNWWEPNLDSAIAVIRSVVDGSAPPLPSPRDRIVQAFSWANSAARLLAILPE